MIVERHIPFFFGNCRTFLLLVLFYIIFGMSEQIVFKISGSALRHIKRRHTLEGGAQMYRGVSIFYSMYVCGLIREAVAGGTQIHHPDPNRIRILYRAVKNIGLNASGAPTRVVQVVLQATGGGYTTVITAFPV